MKGVWAGITLGTALARAANPGAVDSGFVPELRAPAVPAWTILGPDGRSWVGGGFDRADGGSTGDLLVLGENGGVAREPAPGYLAPDGLEARAPFPLADGSFLLPAASGEWLRLNANGTPAGPAFPGLAAGESLTPQFEREGKLWCIRASASGRARLERRESADGSIDPTFSPGTDWPDDVLEAVPEALGGAWVLTGDQRASSGLLLPGTEPKDQHIFLVHGSGAVTGEMRVLSGYRPAMLAPRADSGVTVVLGDDRSRWNFWPAPTAMAWTIEWRSAEGLVQRSRNFGTPFNQSFAWAEGQDGSLLVTGPGGALIRYDAAGLADASFQSPGKVRHVAALPGGKWLVDGVRRLNADGSADASWAIPDLDRPGTVNLLEKLPDDRVLVAGDFDEVAGASRKGLALFEADGSLDTSFSADGRVGALISAAATADGIYVATAETVSLGNQLASNLLKLNFDGSIDEDYGPATYGGPWIVNPADTVSLGIGDVRQLDALKSGDLMVSSYGGSEVASARIARLLPDGSGKADFRRSSQFASPEELVPVSKGGYASGGVFFKEDGSVSRDIRREGFKLDPLAEWQGGMLFLDRDENSVSGRLRLWKGKGWVGTFTSQRVMALPVAEVGEKSLLYVAGTFGGASDMSLRRLTPNGKLDPQFRSAVFGKRYRREAGEWWTAGPGGKVPFNPASYEERAAVSAMLWNSGSGKLWVAGDFNVVDGQNRDGIAWITGGTKVPPTRARP
ncbi:delta-60 repeat domain-containing protein [Haloferula sp. BvORR071]|uniref:delta-60 repeat domain-containing protein n=1 Tax=Haloferula sp. BvORR071 TaxID=1396141 RepID=UPI002240F273|nr:delta-60 repeat domain-containing protein [Haloferula sp. BvORR071]